MAINPANQNVFFLYTSDNGTVYTAITKRGHLAAAGGSPGFNGNYLPKEIHMRHIGGKTGDTNPQRAQLVIPDPANALWTSDAVGFSLNGTGYTKEGSIGERRLVKALFS